MERLEKIWKLIDGEMDATEKAAFEQTLATDPILRKEYETQLKLHQSLITLPPQKALEGFTAQVMSKIQSSTSRVSSELYSFAGFKGILAWIVGMIVLATILILSISPAMIDSSVTTYTYLGDYLDKLSLDMSISDQVLRYSSYLAFLIIIPIIVGIDNVLGSHYHLKRVAYKK